MKLREVRTISDSLRLSILNFPHLRFVRLQVPGEGKNWITVSSRSFPKDIRVDPMEAMKHQAKTLNLL